MPKRTLSTALLLFLAACQPMAKGRNKYDKSTVDKTPVDGGNYIEASIADAIHLNPIFSTDSASNDINNAVYNGLVKYDKDIKLIGDLAESWKIENDGKIITFSLKGDMYVQN